MTPFLMSLSPDEVVNSLFPNVWVFVAHIIATIVLLIVLTKWVYHPFILAMRARRQKIADRIQAAAVEQAEATKNNMLANQRLTSAKSEANELIVIAKKDAEQEKTGIITSAQGEADKIVTEAKATIVRERAAAESEIHDQIADVALQAAETIIKKNLNAKDQQQLIDDAIKNLS